MNVELGSQVVSEKREKVFKASVSVLLKYHTNGLILVRIGDSKWGPPAGGLEMGEYLIDAVRREVEEETGIDKANLYFGRRPGGDESVKFLTPRYVLNIPKEGKTDIGLAFEAEYHGPRLPREGWKVTGDEEITLAKPFYLTDVLRLLGTYLKGREVLYRPDFNFPLFMAYVLNQEGHGNYFRGRNSGRFEKFPRYINSWLFKNKEKIEHLRLVTQKDTIFDRDVSWWDYDNPVLTGIELQEAQKRAWF